MALKKGQTKKYTVTSNDEFEFEEYCKSILKKPLAYEQFSFYTPHEKKLAKKYFDLWAVHVQYKRKCRIIENKCRILDLKVSDYLKNLKKKLASRPNKTPIESVNTVTKEVANGNKKFNCGETYGNRYLAQKQLIKNQEALINEQKKVINELKLQQDLKIVSDIAFTEVNNKIETIPVECTNKTIVKPDTHPLVRKMMERDEERKQQRAFFEMKRLEKEKYIAEKLEREKEERKRMEVERRKNKIREKREQEKRLRLEEEERQRETEFCTKLMATARRSRDIFLKAKIIYNWRAYTDDMIETEKRCKSAIQKYIVRSYLVKWRTYILRVRSALENASTVLFKQTIFFRSWNLWKQTAKRTNTIKAAALNCYNRRKRLDYFQKWANYTRKCARKHEQFTAVVAAYKERMLLRRTLNLWRSLPRVLFNEREREKRLREWENKVKSILPDYNFIGGDDEYEF